MRTLILAFVFLLTACSKKEPPSPTIPQNTQTYFPPATGDEWESTSAASLGWDVGKLNEAIEYAGTTNGYGLMILHKGRIVTEKYWNNWNANTKYPINSAGKSVTAFLVGMAQQEGNLKLDDKTAQYLGTGWTSLPPDKEALVTIRHHLTMTTGFEDNVPDDNCSVPSCLTYKTDAGSRWAYHNAPYRLLQTIVAAATGTTFSQYTQTRLAAPIGMKNASWNNGVLWLNTRDMARFGLLTANKGTWGDKPVLSDPAYFNAMVNASQNFNRSYGYLWWLNGKASFMLPSIQTVFAGSMNPDAPADMLMALGKDDKKIYVVPSLDLVVVTHGNDAGTSTAGPSSFDNAFWSKLRLAVKKW